MKKSRPRSSDRILLYLFYSLSLLLVLALLL